jgi:hypothetical protein
MNTSPDHNAVFESGRRIVQEYVSEQTRAGKLDELTTNEQEAVSHLVNTSLFKVIVSGEVKLSMVRRWMSEAIASQNVDPEQKPVLTGEVIYDLLNQLRGVSTSPWQNINKQADSYSARSKNNQAEYTQFAQLIMEHLRLCYSCGGHLTNSKQDALDSLTGAQYCDKCRQGKE